MRSPSVIPQPVAVCSEPDVAVVIMAQYSATCAAKLRRCAVDREGHVSSSVVPGTRWSSRYDLE
jgi:hypothetical protein